MSVCVSSRNKTLPFLSFFNNICLSFPQLLNLNWAFILCLNPNAVLVLPKFERRVILSISTSSRLCCFLFSLSSLWCAQQSLDLHAACGVRSTRSAPSIHVYKKTDKLECKMHMPVRLQMILRFLSFFVALTSGFGCAAVLYKIVLTRDDNYGINFFRLSIYYS